MRIASLAVLLALLACSSGSSSPTATPDAGPDGSSGADATDDSCFPFCASSSSGGGSSSSGSDDGGGDGALSCADQKANLEALETAARACNPQAPNQCTGTTEGVCCPVSVSPGDDTAVNNFEVALATYKQQCSPSCLGVVCLAAPSMTCQAVQGAPGVCK
jgi:hypothetical protein